MTSSEFHYKILLIRRFEERLLDLFSLGKLSGTTHSYIGQEAIAVGVLSNIKNSGHSKILVDENNYDGEYDFVYLYTLDSILIKENMENITFIKIDVEGYEIEVLEGAVNTIKKYKPNLCIEINEDLYKKRNKSFIDILERFLILEYNYFYAERDLVFSKVTLLELKKLIMEKKQFDCLFMQENNE